MRWTENPKNMVRFHVFPQINQIKQKHMIFLAVDKDGTEGVYEGRPERAEIQVWWSYDGSVRLPKGSIKKLIGKDLTWQDEPVEII